MQSSCNTSAASATAERQHGSGLILSAPAAILPQRTLRVAALRGSMWVMISYGLSQAIRLGANLVLLWLLYPSAWGLIAIVNVMLQGLTMFSDIGIGPSIIQNKRGDHREFLHTAWTMQVARGLALGLAACALAWPMAAFYARSSEEYWQLAVLIPVAGLASVLAGLNSTALFTLNRRLHMGRLSAIELCAQVFGVAVMIGWALLHPSVWALVAGGLAVALAKMVLSHVVIAEHRMWPGWDWRCARELFGYGKWIFLSTALTFLASQGDRLIVGAIVQPEVLGFYAIALMLAFIPAEIILALGGRVVFPAYSRLYNNAKNNPIDAIKSPFRRTRFILLILGGLATSYLVGTGQSIAAVLDPRYAEVGWMLQLLAVGAWFRVLECTSGAALLAMGRPSWVAAGNFARIVGMCAAVPLGYWAYGFPGVVVALVATDLLRYVVLAGAAQRYGLPVVWGDLGIIVWWCASVAALLYGNHLMIEAGLTAMFTLLLALLLAFAAWSPLAARCFRLLRSRA